MAGTGVAWMVVDWVVWSAARKVGLEVQLLEIRTAGTMARMLVVRRVERWVGKLVAVTASILAASTVMSKVAASVE